MAGGGSWTAAAPAQRRQGRNADWKHLYNMDVVSVPDKWEYPWYAAWDLAFHTVPLAMIDPEWAKRQLILLLREWYMHPNGQLPAYEWNFSDVNPPIHAWARVACLPDRAKPLPASQILCSWKGSFKSCCSTLPGG